MLYCTAAILYGALSITLGKATRNSLATFLSGVIIAVSIAHFFIGDVKTFRRTFLAMLLSVLFQCIWLLSARVPDARVKREAQYLALYGTGKLTINMLHDIADGLVTFTFGFILWNIDNKFCGQLTQARDVVGMPLGFVTEFHGWWHIFTGIGVYDYIVFIEYLRSYIKAVGEKDNSTLKPTLIWPNSFSLPYLVLRKK